MATRTTGVGGEGRGGGGGWVTRSVCLRAGTQAPQATGLALCTERICRQVSKPMNCPRKRAHEPQREDRKPKLPDAHDCEPFRRPCPFPAKLGLTAGDARPPGTSCLAIARLSGGRRGRTVWVEVRCAPSPGAERGVRLLALSSPAVGPEQMPLSVPQFPRPLADGAAVMPTP